MKRTLLVLGIIVLLFIMLYNEDTKITKNDLEYKLEELEDKITYLEDEKMSLESQLEDANKQLDIKDEYIEELQQLLKENDIDEWEGIDIFLKDKNGEVIPPSNKGETQLKIEKDNQ